MYKGSLIFNTQPLVVNPELAMLIGLNESIVLQQIHYWLNINEKADKNYYEDKYWVYNTVSDWQEQFPFWSYDTVKRTLKSLRNMNLLITGNFNKVNYDRTLWYTINYDEVSKLDEKLEEIIKDKKTKLLEKKAKKNPQTIENSQWGKMHQCKDDIKTNQEKTSKPLETAISAKCPNGKVQNAPMEKCKMPQPIPEINTDTNTEIINQSIPKKEVDRLIEKYSLEYIREMLETDGYATDRQGNLYEELTNLVFDVVNSDSKTIKVNGTLLPTEVVRSRFLKLNPGNLLYVIEVFRKQTTKVHNIRQYLITALYNSFSSIDSYYTNAVNHDLYGAKSV